MNERRFTEAANAGGGTALALLLWAKPYQRGSHMSTMQSIRHDYSRLAGKNPSVLRIVRQVLTDPGFRAVVLYRLGRRAVLRKQRVRAKLYSVVMFHMSQTTINLHADIGPGLTIRHVGAIVIGGRTVIGRNCDIRQGVTIGGNSGRKVDGRSQPVIGDGVRIGAGAKVVGPVLIGNNAIIGANAVVLSDVPDGGVAAGVPAAVIRIGGDAVPVIERSGSLGQILGEALSRLAELEQRVEQLTDPQSGSGRSDG